MYQKVDTNLNFVDREKKVEEFWKENHIFEKSMENRKEGETYTFYDGPPTANGKPHIGHVLTRVIKDMIPRYRTMKGYMVPRKAGWDTHGLPVELEVEKKLGLDGKEQIEEYGMEPFIKQCKESVWKYKGMWEDFSSTVGFWADMEHPYVTYYDDYIESEWWALKEIWNKKLLYKGFKIVPYCPRCGTPLSAQEVSQGYKTVKERSAVVRFKVVGEDAYFLAWTTTPWTLPSNVALCVNPDETYCKVKAADGYTYYMAEALLDKVLGKLAKEEGEKAYEVLETYKGTDLEYKAYEPLFACAGEAAAKQKKKAHFVTCDNYVTMSDGTGIVHIAPAFGEDDSRIGRNYELPFVQFVDGQGNLTKETPYAGVFVKKADPMVLTDLDKEGKLFDAPKFEHDYPHCWRCDTPLIYYARESWFIKMTAVKDDLIRNNNTINWIPESIGKGRFGDWLENVQDWGISRNRYWGTPLNIWQCECGHMHSIGSRQELFEMSGDERAKTVELHRPYIDEITLKCPECGGTMHRVPEVIDCWFDSGAMPFAQHHYPFENKDLFEQQYTVTLTPVSETRYKTVSHTNKDGTTSSRRVAYTYKILYVTVRNRSLGTVVRELLTEDEYKRYLVIFQQKGNRPDIFGDNIYANPSEGPKYEIPGEALSDPSFKALITEAEKYLGYPYVWGGSSPSTSFDCSGFVSWVINHSGWDVGRLGAQGLCNICTPVSSANVKPGDLVFFTGTYDTPGVSHVGIYVGNNMMIHCGDPISYANLNSSYWQSHFYRYGRLP